MIKVESAEDRQSSNNPVEMHGIVGALAKALASRRPACVNSGEIAVISVLSSA